MTNRPEVKPPGPADGAGRQGRLTGPAPAAKPFVMRDDQIFGLVLLVAMLFWLGARMMPPNLRPGMERLAFILVGGGIVVALALSVAHFMG